MIQYEIDVTLGVVGSYSSAQFETVHRGHLPVTDDDVDLGLFDILQGLLTVFSLEHTVAPFEDGLFEEIQCRNIVVHQ